jgi:protein SCO1
VTAPEPFEPAAIIGSQRRLPVLGMAALAIAALLGLIAPAAAHSLAEVDQDLRDKEHYFQAVDSDAPGFTLQDADGRTVSLEDLGGKVVVLNFVYTNCPDVCPLHAERIAEIQKMINQTPMKEMVEFVTITTDPKHDTGAVLQDYGEAHGLDPANWVFLTSSADKPEDATRGIAEAYGLKFTGGEDGMQMHGIVTHVIDQDGRLRARFHGLKFEPVNLVVFVNALTNRTQKPHAHPEPGFWDKLKGSLPW